MCSSRSSLDGLNSPLALSDLRSPSPPTPALFSRKNLCIKMEECIDKKAEKEKRKGLQKRLSASDVYNCDMLDISSHDRSYNESYGNAPTLATGKQSMSFSDRDESVTSELKLSNLKSGSESSSLGSTGSYYDSINTDINNLEDEGKLMHVEVAFEWNPIPTEEIRYLPPAAHMWNPDHTLSPDKRLPPVRSALCSVAPGWISTTKPSPLFGCQSVIRDKMNKNVSNLMGDTTLQNNKLHFPADSLEDEHHHRFEAMGKMRNKLKGMNGAVRVKNIDRPSVLSMVQGSSVGSHKDLNTSKESLYGTRSGNVSSKSSSCEQDFSTYETNMTDSLDRLAIAQTKGQLAAMPVQCENAPVTHTNTDLDSRVRQILAHIAAGGPVMTP